ncbi:MAG: hypothetical protein LBS07_05435, partial [Prevotellaceae bacterium]|nr:hypothetical protein [Prevotellaceae bacterium]
EVPYDWDPPSSSMDWIKDVQWSANFSMGTSYKIYRNLGLYIEPSLVYCFDNNQPISIRTRQPLNININIGLQYKFLN